jgi:uncharacterized protein YndB with AHSA1/START domain
MADVRFRVTRTLDLPAEAVFEELVDWVGHAAWVPLTRVQIETGDGGPGTVFVATSGIGPLALPDRMRVDALDRESMTVRVTKIGPVLTGTVDLTVQALDETRSQLDWYEDIRVPVLPQLLAGPVAAAARVAFSLSIAKMAKLLATRQGVSRSRAARR